MPTVTLFITPDPNVHGNYLVVVNGEGFHGAVADAKVGVRIRGDDEWYDDKLFNFDPAFPGRVGHDGSFGVSESVPGSKLNEDWGQDEVYALVSVQGFGDLRTNTIKGSF